MSCSASSTIRPFWPARPALSLSRLRWKKACVRVPCARSVVPGDAKSSEGPPTPGSWRALVLLLPLPLLRLLLVAGGSFSLLGQRSPRHSLSPVGDTSTTRSLPSYAGP